MMKNLFFPLLSGLSIIGLGIVTSSSLRAQDLPPEVIRYADMVMYNGQVLTMDQDMPAFSICTDGV